jgi:hypothetical protein
MSKTNNIIGFLGAKMLAACGIPMVIDVVSKQDASGYDSLFLGLWLGGEVFLLYYVLNQEKRQYPLIFNYLANILLISIVVYYKL